MARGRRTRRPFWMAVVLAALAGAGCRFNRAGLGSAPPADRAPLAPEGGPPDQATSEAARLDGPGREQIPPLDFCLPCPDGWSAAIVYDRPSSSAPAGVCPAGWTEFSTPTAMQGPKGGCTACKCDKPAGRTCGPATFECQHDPACTSASNCSSGEVAADGSCVDFGCDNICSNARVLVPAGPTGGSCAASGGDVKAVSWSSIHDLCVPAAPAGSCAGSCLPPAGSFQHAGCVVQEGDPSCPAGFPKRAVLYTGVDDTRSCSCPDCSAPSGGSCAGSVALFPCKKCGGGATGEFPATGGTCYPADKAISCDGNNPSIRSARYAGLTADGSCTPAQVVETGGLTPTGPITVCCH